MRHEWRNPCNRCAEVDPGPWYNYSRSRTNSRYINFRLRSSAQCIYRVGIVPILEIEVIAKSITLAFGMGGSWEPQNVIVCPARVRAATSTLVSLFTSLTNHQSKLSLLDHLVADSQTKHLSRTVYRGLSGSQLIGIYALRLRQSFFGPVY